MHKRLLSMRLVQHRAEPEAVCSKRRYITQTDCDPKSCACDKKSACNKFCGFQVEVTKIEEDHAVVLEEKESTIQDMEKKVKTSQQFLDQKDTMDSALQQLQQTLELERKQHKEHIG